MTILIVIASIPVVFAAAFTVYGICIGIRCACQDAVSLR